MHLLIALCWILNLEFLIDIKFSFLKNYIVAYSPTAAIEPAHQLAASQSIPYKV
jgi:hypothetical protein